MLERLRRPCILGVPALLALEIIDDSFPSLPRAQDQSNEPAEEHGEMSGEGHDVCAVYSECDSDESYNSCKFDDSVEFDDAGDFGNSDE